MKKYLNIAIPVPLRKSFHYLPPKSFPEDTRPGCRIKVPFGNKTLTGILIDYSSKTITDEAKLKRAEELLDSSPILPKGILELCGRQPSGCATGLGNGPGGQRRRRRRVS